MVISFFEVTDIERKEFDKVFSRHNKVNFFEEAIQNVDMQKYQDSDVICVFVHSKVSKDTIDKNLIYKQTLFILYNKKSRLLPASKLERKTRFELATLALARRCSTPEPLPHI